MTRVTQQRHRNPIARMRPITCSVCGGTGRTEIAAFEVECPKCKGKGFGWGRKLTVNVTRGNDNDDMHDP